MDDTINRQAAIDALVWNEDNAGEVAERNQWKQDSAAIKALPSAERHGRWIIDKHLLNIGTCSICGDQWGVLMTCATVRPVERRWKMNRINKRYVDIDDVLDLFGVEDEDLYATGTIEDALYDGTLKVHELPFAERQGQWEPYLNEGLIVKCSVCGSRYVARWNYCPNCGAKMDLNENE